MLFVLFSSKIFLNFVIKVYLTDHIVLVSGIQYNGVTFIFLMV